MDSNHVTDQVGTLQEYAVVQERPFVSHFPILGPLIVRFRTFWNNIATRWYVLPLLQQQNQCNLMLADIIIQLNSRVLSLDDRGSQLHTTIFSLDREGSNLTHNLAELTAQLIQMNRQLQNIEQRLQHLENQSSKLL